MTGLHSVSRVHSVNVVLGDQRPAFLRDAEAAIAAHWADASVANPDYFDGAIVMIADWHIAGDAFVATAFPARFRDYLYWRRLGRPECGFRHLFGSAAIILASGELVMVRAADGTMNSGLLHLPGGFVDQSDVLPETMQVDLRSQIERELGEELGIAPADVSWSGGFLIVEDNNEVGVAGLLRPCISDDALRERLTGYIGRQEGEARENTGVAFIRPGLRVPDADVTPYCAPILDWLSMNPLR